MPSNRQRNPYPDRSHTFLDDVSDDERDEDAIALQAAVDHRSVGPIN